MFFKYFLLGKFPNSENSTLFSYQATSLLYFYSNTFQNFVNIFDLINNRALYLFQKLRSQLRRIKYQNKQITNIDRFR